MLLDFKKKIAYTLKMTYAKKLKEEKEWDEY